MVKKPSDSNLHVKRSGLPLVENRYRKRVQKLMTCAANHTELVLVGGVGPSLLQVRVDRHTQERNTGCVAVRVAWESAVRIQR